jgi:GNAT superfamily N-acetyltransferase
VSAFSGWLYIADLVVAASCRRQGYGRQLLAAAAESWGVEAGCHGAWLQTMSFQARGSYERSGYQVCGEHQS